MKAYIKPTTIEVLLKSQPLLSLTSNAVNKVDGLDGVTTSSDDFVGGAADSRRGGSLWDDED